MFSGYEKDNVKIIYPTVEEKKTNFKWTSICYLRMGGVKLHLIEEGANNKNLIRALSSQNINDNKIQQQ